MPSPRYATGISRVNAPVIRQDGSDGSVTTETVGGSAPGGKYLIRGIATPTRDNLTLLTGDTVSVAWRRGVPFMILDSRMRRGPGTDETFGGAPAVEELFVTAPPAGGVGKFKVWFRNGTDLKPILEQDYVPPFGLVTIDGVLVDVTDVRWSGSSPDYFALLGIIDSNAHRFVAVYKIKRQRSRPIARGARIKPTLVRLYDITDPAGPSFGTISVSSGTASAANPMRAFSGVGATGSTPISGAFITVSAIVQSEYAGIASNGDLLLRVNVKGSSTITGAQPGQASFADYFVGQLIVNFTRGTVLVSRAPNLTVPLFIIVVVSDPPLIIACASAGSVTTSTGHGADSGARAEVELINARVVDGVAEVRSYAALEHDDLNTSSTTLGGMTTNSCYPNGGSAYSAAIFRVVGEHEQVIATLPAGTVLTAQRALFQASRQRVFWAKVANSSLIAPLKLFLTDLKSKVTDEVGENPAVVVSPVTPITQRQMLAVSAGQIYAPQGPSTATPPAPFNEQFFVDGTAKTIDQASLKKKPQLRRFAALKKAKKAEEIAAVQLSACDIQVINSSEFGSSRDPS